MTKKTLQKKARSLVVIAKEKGLITEYKDFLKTDLAKETALTKEEIAYYTSLVKGAKTDEKI